MRELFEVIQLDHWLWTHDFIQLLGTLVPCHLLLPSWNERSLGGIKGLFFISQYIFVTLVDFFNKVKHLLVSLLVRLSSQHQVRVKSMGVVIGLLCFRPSFDVHHRDVWGFLLFYANWLVLWSFRRFIPADVLQSQILDYVRVWVIIFHIFHLGLRLVTHDFIQTVLDWVAALLLAMVLRVGRVGVLNVNCIISLVDLVSLEVCLKRFGGWLGSCLIIVLAHVF